MVFFLSLFFDFGMIVFGPLLTLSAIFLPIYGPIASRFCAFSAGMACIFSFLICNISVKRFDKKYKKKLLAHKKAKDLVYVSFFFSPETAIQLKNYRMFVYIIKMLKDNPKYYIRKEILPEYSYKEVKLIDKIFLTGLCIFGIFFFITVIICIVKGYF